MKRPKLTAVFVFATVCSLLLQPSVSGGEKRGDALKYFFMSFAVPGLGQYKAGSMGYAKLFLATELAIWGSYYYNDLMKDARREDYFSHAALHAGVSPSGFGTSYLNVLGAYNSSFEHNNYKKQTQAYPVLYSGSQAWEWDSVENRLSFRYLRERELDYENNLKYCLAAVVFNHFLSGLHASKLVRQSTGTVITVNVLDQGIGARFMRSF